MNNTSALAPSNKLPLSVPNTAQWKVSLTGISFNGVVLFTMCFLLIGSGMRAWRPEIMGLLLHPYLIPVGLAFPFVVMSRLGEFPARVGGALLAFVGIYYFSILAGGGIVLGEVFKIASSAVTILVSALLVRRRGDFVAAALGMALGMAVLGFSGLQEDHASGVKAIDVANKNSYSLYALPSILLCGFICLRMPTVPKWIKTSLIVCSLIMLAAIFMTGQSFGVSGAVVIGGMLFWNRRGQGLLLVGLVVATLVFAITRYGDTRVFDERMRQTVEGNDSDDYRIAIAIACVRVGMSNPVIGVSPQKLPFELGRATQIGHGYGLINSHNVFGHVLGGSGVFCSLALFAIAWTIWYWSPRNGVRISSKNDPLYEARSLARMMVFLWALSGFFTNEILYNPAFNIGIGLCIGLCMLADRARESMLSASAAQALAALRTQAPSPRPASQPST